MLPLLSKRSKLKKLVCDRPERVVCAASECGHRSHSVGLYCRLSHEREWRRNSVEEPIDW